MANFPVVLVFPKGDTYAMDTVQTDQGRVQQPKTLTAHSDEEVARLQAIGWARRVTAPEAE